MTQTCRPAKCIEAIRVTLLDQCTLLSACGPLNGYAMGCIIEPNWTPEIEEGEESVVKDNCGQICLRDDRCDQVKRFNIEFKIKEPDAEFLSLIEGNPLVVDAGESIGVRYLANGNCSPYVFLELFERTDDCDAQGVPVYYRHVFPAVRLKQTSNEREGIFRTLMIEGKTRPVVTDSIGTGPYGDFPVGVLVGASASETIDYAWFVDDFLPAIQCGSIDVPCPITYPLAVLADNPGAYWQLNDLASPAVDTVAGNNLTENGPLTWQAGALRGGGSSVTGWSGVKYLRRVDPTGFVPAVPFTIEAIIDIGPALPGALGVIYDYDGVAGAGVYFYVDNLGHIVGRVGTGVMIGTVPLLVNTVYHVALVVSAGTFQFYVNGVAYGPATAHVGYVITAGSSVFVGVSGTGAPWPAAGRISDVAEYPVALTQPQIAAHVAAMP